MITGPVLEEEIGFRFYQRRAAELPRVSATVQRRREMVGGWIASQPRLEWVAPGGGVVAFPRIRRDAGVDVERFYQLLNGTYGTYVGPGHWFEQDRRYMRIGFGWPEEPELEEGLQNIATALEEAGGG